jgi:hypothetical protein
MQFGLRFDRFFECLQSRIESIGKPLVVNHEKAPNELASELTAWMECISNHEMYSMLKVLAEQTYIDIKYLPERIHFTAKGYERLDKIRAHGAANNRVFVAMWYDPSLSDAYEFGIQEAVKDAGYDPVHLNFENYLNSINDKIIAEIRRSHFIVADFTCRLLETQQGETAAARGNVYFEAGFALGLGVPVIWCCRSDCINHLHFDTMQFSHIKWKTPQDLRTTLRNRIVGAFGLIDRARAFSDLESQLGS